MLVAHPDIDGVWTANDDMGMGAIQALKEAGLAGKVLVTGADGVPEMFDAIKGGLAAATILNDGKYQFQLGLAMALAAKQGKLDVKSMPQKYRQFEIPAVNVNRDNVEQGCARLYRVHAEVRSKRFLRSVVSGDSLNRLG